MGACQWSHVWSFAHLVQCSFQEESEERWWRRGFPSTSFNVAEPVSKLAQFYQQKSCMHAWRHVNLLLQFLDHPAILSRYGSIGDFEYKDEPMDWCHIGWVQQWAQTTRQWGDRSHCEYDNPGGVQQHQDALHGERDLQTAAFCPEELRGHHCFAQQSSRHEVKDTSIHAFIKFCSALHSCFHRIWWEVSAR